MDDLDRPGVAVRCFRGFAVVQCVVDRRLRIAARHRGQLRRREGAIARIHRRRRLVPALMTKFLATVKLGIRSLRNAFALTVSDCSTKKAPE